MHMVTTYQKSACMSASSSACAHLILHSKSTKTSGKVPGNAHHTCLHTYPHMHACMYVCMYAFCLLHSGKHAVCTMSSKFPCMRYLHTFHLLQDMAVALFFFAFSLLRLSHPITCNSKPFPRLTCADRLFCFTCTWRARFPSISRRPYRKWRLYCPFLRANMSIRMPALSR